MIDVFISVDTEVWCGGWTDLDRRFPDAFRRYVYGPTLSGNCALPLTLQMLNDHGLQASFFVEPLFSLRFGRAPLQEIVGLIQAAGQEIQLHLHTEWVDEARKPIFAGAHGKRQYLFQFSREEQSTLVRVGRDCLQDAGVPGMSTLRAGSFGMGPDTIHAVAAGGLAFDSSFDVTRRFPINRVLRAIQPVRLDGIIEYPLSAFRDGSGRLRPVQVGACSFAELERIHWAAVDAGWTAVVILSHNFELLTPAKTRVDRVVARRFERLCRFLSRHPDVFRVRGFNGLEARLPESEMAAVRVGLAPTARRWVEQAVRDVIYRR